MNTAVQTSNFYFTTTFCSVTHFCDLRYAVLYIRQVRMQNETFTYYNLGTAKNHAKYQSEKTPSGPTFDITISLIRIMAANISTEMLVP